MNSQRIQDQIPEEKEQDLAFTIMCKECKTYRTYIFTESLKLLFNRTSKSMGIEVTCENCENVIDMALGWIERKDGYSFEQVGVGEEFIIVSDNIGLRDHKKENRSESDFRAN